METHCTCSKVQAKVPDQRFLLASVGLPYQVPGGIRRSSSRIDIACNCRVSDSLRRKNSVKVEEVSYQLGFSKPSRWCLLNVYSIETEHRCLNGSANTSQQRLLMNSPTASLEEGRCMKNEVSGVI